MNGSLLEMSQHNPRQEQKGCVDVPSSLWMPAAVIARLLRAILT